MPPLWRVESYFVNVGLGDGAIHLLLDESQTEKPKKIVSAVLVDGGLRGDDQIEYATKAIIKKYGFSQERFFTFDAVVVTHWDRDHYEATMSMIESNFKGAGYLKCRWISNKTIFYVPETLIWTQPRDGLKKMYDFAKDEKELHIKMEKDKIPTKVKPKTPAKGKPEKNVPTKKLAKALYGKACLGVDVFSGEKIGTGATLKVILTNAKPDPLSILDRPMLLCVGIDRRLINGLELPISSSTATNASSMMCILLKWNKTAQTVDVQLYTGGDAEDDQEVVMRNWLVKSGVKKLDVIKCGHHGSSNATHSRLFDLDPEYFIMSVGEDHGHPTYFGYRQKFGAKKRIFSTRYPYWLEQMATAIDPIEQKHLNLGKLLDKAQIFYRAELQRLNPSKKGPHSDLIDIYFPNFSTRLQNICKIMPPDKLDQYNKLFTTVREYKKEHTLTKGDQRLWRDLEKLDKKKWEKWSELQNDVIEVIRVLWYGFGEPIWPVNTKKLFNLREILWIYVKFFDSTAPVPTATHYPANVKVNISTRYLDMSAEAKLARLKVRNSIMDRLGETRIMAQNIDTKKTNNTMNETYQGYLMRLKNPKVSNMVKADVRELSPVAAVEVDKVDLMIWEFLTQDLALSSMQAGSMKRFEVATKIAGSLTWFRESLRANAVEVTLKQGDAVTSNIESFAIFSTVSSTASLKFSSSPEVIKSQFGTSPPDDMNFRGYHYDIETVLLGLDIKANFNLQFSQFASIIYFGLDGVSKWIMVLIGNIPLEIRAPDPNTASTPVDPSNLKRCGIWFQPQFNNRTILRLESVIPADHTNIKAFTDFIKDNLQASDISDFRVIGSVCSTLAELPAEAATAADIPHQSMVTHESHLSFTGSLNWDKSNSRIDFAMTIIDGTSVSLFLQPPKTLTLRDIADWIISRFGHSMGEDDKTDATNSESGFTKILDKFAKSIIPRQFSLNIGEGPALISFQVDVELQLNLGSDQKHVPILGQVKWVPGRLELLGEIWSLEDQDLVPFKLHPYREIFSEVKPDPLNAVDHIFLPNLFDPDAKVEDFPKAIPLKLSEASVKLSLGEWKKFVIRGKIQCVPPKTDDKIMPAIWLDELQLMYFRDISAESNEFELRGNIELKAPNYIFSANSASIVRVYMAYNDGWILSAEAVDLQVANLYNLFPVDGSNHALMSLMANIWIPELSLTVIYAKQQPSTLDFEGMFLVGPLQMGLEYHHGSDGWNLSGELRAVAPEIQDVTLEHLLYDLLHDYVDSFPDFVRNLKIPLSKISARLTCASKMLAGTISKNVVFAFTLTIQTGTTEKDNFSLYFVQIQNQDGAFPAQSEQNKRRPKRILRFSLTGLPEAKNIPVVQNLPQPFDEMDFLWASEDVTVAEAKLLNQEVFKGNVPPLHWRTTALKAGSEDDTKAKALASGCHFQLILREQDQSTCALDYVFNGSNKPAAQPKQDGQGGASAGATSSVAQPGASTSGGTAMTPVTRSSKGLTIRNMGLKMKNKNTLSITLDALVSLGPLAFTLIGFQMDINFENFNTPSDITKLGVGFSLNGMAVAFSRPPVTLAGMFAREVTGNVTTYSGGIAIGVGVWQFLAAGVYEEHEDFKTVFVFAKLNGPIISFGFAEVNGLVGGFGYNSSLRFPPIDEVTEFPFVSINTGSPAASNITEQFTALTRTKGDKAWFKSQKDSLWLAAGLGVKAFQMLDVQAVVCIDLSPQPKIGIFAEAVAMLPKGVSEDKSFLFLDFGIAASIDPGAGVLSLQGELTPRSYVFSHRCKLTGGFALVYFLPASGHDGDWVFTAGGYHPAFKVPAHYPQNVKRVGISWSYDSEISITGEAYFAITPQAVMGGGRLDLVYQSGHTRASFSAYADFLIFYEPFQLQARVGVNVFASARIGWGLLSKDVSTEVSAEVELHGPPVAGVAHMHFWFFSISVRFGPDHYERDPLDWLEFYTLVKQCHELKDAKALPEHVFNLVQGRLSTDTKNEIAPTPKKGEKPPTDLWLVRAPLFEFEVTARFPLGEVKFNNKPLDEGVKARAKDIYSTPMKRGNPFAKSELVVMIRDLTQGIDADMQLEPIMKNIPGALWNKYDSNKSLLDSDTTVEHVMGLKFRPTKAHESQENLPPINIKDFHSVLVGGKNFTFPPTEYVHELDVKPIKEKDKLDPNAKKNQAVVLKLWDNLRHHTTGGGPAYQS